jgi:prolyl-tRNA synthetase
MTDKVNKPKKQEKNELGLTAEKDEFSDWFTQIMLKADLADYTEVSGCIVFKPTAYEIWENIRNFVDIEFKKLGIKNCYFPLFIPEKYLNKEKEHLKGFSPEVAWVTHAGDTKLSERLAVRPTSETIMYPSYSNWIRSWRDLPLKLNQWNNVIRWEFKHPVPFLRTREFLWNEGHTVYATKKEAENEEHEIIKIYKKVCEDYLALPSLVGRKSEKEKFAGAEYTVSMEFYMPNGKSIQGPDFHHDGQNFSKAYDIKFLNKGGKEEYAYQNTFAITTRMLGVMFAVHSDEKGLILPPRIAPNEIVIIPIFTDENKKQILEATKKISESLKEFDPIVDDREDQRPGFKFNEYELRGIPLRIEIGARDLEKKEATVFRRDTLKKQQIKISNLAKEIPAILEDIQKNLYKKAEKLLHDSILQVENLKELQNAIENKKIALAPMCKSRECEDDLKFKTNGAKVLNIDENQPKQKGNCVICSKSADYIARVGKSY